MPEFLYDPNGDCIMTDVEMNALTNALLDTGQHLGAGMTTTL